MREKGFFMSEFINDPPKAGMQIGGMFGFIPMHLSVPDRPELIVFAHKVLFSRQRLQHGKVETGYAVYVPDIGSYVRAGDIQSLEYHNKYGPTDWLKITYDSVKQTYKGEKFIKGLPTGTAIGTGWGNFFFHFSRLGVVEEEQCLFSDEGDNTVS